MFSNEVVCLAFPPVLVSTVPLWGLRAWVHEGSVCTHRLFRAVGLWSAVHPKASHTHTQIHTLSLLQADINIYVLLAAGACRRWLQSTAPNWPRVQLTLWHVQTLTHTWYKQAQQGEDSADVLCWADDQKKKQQQKNTFILSLFLVLVITVAFSSLTNKTVWPQASAIATNHINYGLTHFFCHHLHLSKREDSWLSLQKLRNCTTRAKFLQK